MFAFTEDTVLDPFLGSGTTSMAARNLGRHSIGYEINEDYIPIIRNKLQVEQPDLYGTEYFFLKDNVKTRILNSDGTYTRKRFISIETEIKDAEKDKESEINIQEYFVKKVKKKYEADLKKSHRKKLKKKKKK